MHKTTRHTYGKRGTRARKHRISTKGPDSSSQDDNWIAFSEVEDVSSCIGKERPSSSPVEQPMSSMTVSPIPPVALSSTSHTAWNSLAPDVAICSPRFGQDSPKARSCTHRQHALNVQGEKLILQSERLAGEPSDDMNQSTTPSGDQSEGVQVGMVNSLPQDQKYPQGTNDSDDNLPISKAMRTPRRSTKRYRTLPTRSKTVVDQIPTPNALQVPASKAHLHAGPPKQRNHIHKRPRLHAENSMDSLFDELISDPASLSGVPEAVPVMAKHVRPSFRAKMARNSDSRGTSVSVSCTSSSSMSASPIRLERAASGSTGMSLELKAVFADRDERDSLAHEHPCDQPRHGTLPPTGSPARNRTMVEQLSSSTAIRDKDCLVAREIPETYASTPWCASHTDGAGGATTSLPMGYALTSSTTQDKAINTLHNGSSDCEVLDHHESSGPLRSLLHLRSAGESRLFEDEMNYLLDGLAHDQSLAVRRASSVDILSKTNNEEFIRKLKVYDFVSRLYMAFRCIGAGDGDLVLDITLLLFLYTVCTDEQTVDSIFKAASAEPSGLLGVLFGLHERLWTNDDIAQISQMGGKVEKRLLRCLSEFSTRLLNQRKAHISGEGGAPRYFLIKLSAAICQYLPRSLCNSSAPSFIQVLTGHLLEVIHGIDSPSADPDLCEASLHLLHLLSADNIAGEASSAEVAGIEINTAVDAFTKVVTVGAACLSRPGPIEGDGVNACLAHSLQTLICFVDCNRFWLEALTQTSRTLLPSLVQCVDACTSALYLQSAVRDHAQPGDLRAQQILLLTLSLLQTILEGSSAARRVYQDLYIRNCRDNSCNIGYNCPHETPATTVICRMFLATASKSSSTEAQVIAGYGSLVMIYGSFGSSAAQRLALQGIQARKDAVKTLYDTTRDLLRLREQADELGLDATQTSASDLKSMLSQLESILSSP